MNRVHKEHRIREEVARARADQDFYLSRVDQAKAINAMADRRRQKRGRHQDDGDDANDKKQNRTVQRMSSHNDDMSVEDEVGKKMKKAKKTNQHQDISQSDEMTEKKPKVKREFKQRIMKAKQSKELDDDFISKLL